MTRYESVQCEHSTVVHDDGQIFSVTKYYINGVHVWTAVAPKAST